MHSKRALITGINGQDGSYLSELLASKGYEVHGIMRRTSSSHEARVRERLGADSKAQIHLGDLTDAGSLSAILEAVNPDEVYNLAAQSHVKVSFDNPLYTVDADAIGAARLLEAMRLQIRATGRPIRFYQASSSEMFGKVAETPQREATPFHPRSPYGCAKVFAHWQTVAYREAHGLFACCGILFNHESPRRGEEFVTRKVTRAAARIQLGLQRKLVLGNLDARRDWGFAGDYVEAMWRMLQQPKPDDYVIATGETHSIRELCEVAFGALGMDWRERVETSDELLRPAEVDLLLGDATKARRELGWEPKVGFRQLVEMMVKEDLKLAREEAR